MASASGSGCASTGASLVAANTLAVAVQDTTPVNGAGEGEDGERTTDIGVKESNTKKRKPKRQTSGVWDYFIKSTMTEKGDKGETEEQIWAKCKKCKFKTRGESSRGTTIFWNHLKSRHYIHRGQQELQVQKGEGNNAIVQNFKYDPEASLRKFHLAIVMHEYPFKMVEHEYFVDFIKSLRPHFTFLCRTTTRNEIMTMYMDEKKKLFEQLKSLSCRFSATMDMWTSNQNKGYMSITIHWIDDKWQMQKRIICLPHVKGHHNGELLASEFIKGVMSWNLEKRLFALTLDNAAANDKCVRLVVKELNKLARIQKYPPLVCGGVFFHVRCLCHILNLVAQDGLSVIASPLKNIKL
jgi:hypothetical protein